MTTTTPAAQRQQNLRVAALGMLARLELLEIELQSFLDCGAPVTDAWLRENLASIRAIIAKAKEHL